MTASGIAQMNPIFFNFLPEGSVVLRGFSPDALPQEFETIASATYKLDKPSNPKMIEFTTPRGNDVFVQGVTLVSLLDYDENSFHTRSIASGEERRWQREQTSRSFLTLTARSGPSHQEVPAFAKVISTDGRQTSIRALGVHLAVDGEGQRPVFEEIPQRVYEEIREQNEEEKKNARDETVIMRFELRASEYEKSRTLFSAWDKLAKNHTLPESDPYANTLEFIAKTFDGLEPCGPNVKLQKLDRQASAWIAAQFKPSQRPLEYIRLIRMRDSELHIPDKFFPWSWRQIVQIAQ